MIVRNTNGSGTTTVWVKHFILAASAFCKFWKPNLGILLLIGPKTLDDVIFPDLNEHGECNAGNYITIKKRIRIIDCTSDLT